LIKSNTYSFAGSLHDFYRIAAMHPWLNTFFLGTSGLVLPVPNKNAYPEAFRNSSRLQYYGSLFNSIEINSTFTRLPRHTTVERWASEVPEHFRFTFKLPEAVTHAPQLQFDKQILSQFIDTVNEVGRKKGCLLLQFPAKLQAEHAGKLAEILKMLRRVDKQNEWTLAVELRNASWYEKAIDKLLQRFQAVRVIHDWHSFITPVEASSEVVYLRFHGPEKGYRGDYGQETLKEYAGETRKWLKEDKEVYAYFNNTLGAVMPNLLSFKKEVENG
jgi:uncharacterized protein YecE (DUF72 family)